MGIMTEQKILDGAPDNFNHMFLNDGLVLYTMFCKENGYWVVAKDKAGEVTGFLDLDDFPLGVRSLSDLQTIVDLRAEIAELEKAHTDRVLRIKGLEKECDYKDIRIAELEKERDELSGSVLIALDAFKKYEMDVDEYPTIEHMKIKEKLNESLRVHNLEQQIESLENLCCRLKSNSYLHKETHDMAAIMISGLNQAKALKDGE